MTRLKKGLEQLQSSKVLVTGADGFIASYVCEELVEVGAEVTALVRRKAWNSLENIEHLEGKMKILWGDVTDLSALLHAARSVKIIYHLAAQSHVAYSLLKPVETFMSNALGTLNVLEAARINDVKRVIHAGSAEQYGTPINVPINEDHPLLPRSPYAAAKVSADRLMYAYYCTYGLPVVMPRFFGVFGPRQSIEKAIPKFIIQILNNIPPTIYGDGRQSRDYMYATDAAEAYALLGVKENLVGKTINIGTGIERRIIDVAWEIIRLAKSDLKPIFVGPLRTGEAPRLVSDPSLAKQTLGWYPKVDFIDGLKRTIDYYSKRKDLVNRLSRTV